MGQRSTLAERRAALEREWARWVPARANRVPGSADSATGLRGDVVRSWMRSVRTVDPGIPSAPEADSGDVGARWEASPLRGPVTELADEFRHVAQDAGYVAAVTDESGTILWSFGGAVMRRRAEKVNFAPGGCWDEPHMGTNALSLAMRSGRPATVFSAEHLVAALHGWVCYCAPIHAPDGRQLGVLDLSSTWDRSHPLAMTTVRSLVTAIEARLPDLAPAPPAVRLTCLGDARLVRAGRPVRLRPRHLEILTLLALEPDGFTPERLHNAIYGDRPVTSSTLKADVSHLRSATGGDIANRVYRLTTPVSCDAVDLLAALEAGDTATAVRLYRGPLLPGSDTPGIVEWRDHLAVAVRTAVLTDPDPDIALRYGERAPDDIAVHEHALHLLPHHDSRRAIATARLHTALRG
ncbi:transcriptional regulator [Nocardia puris]|uniref:transcriptional regulator n=1 Tax=Nocardia puris TaxID=208602 RepID=UPI001893BDF1|nr:transcriptional regulator [Nocardia puris]MBF6209845.1 transcriptional regulator [Nocardia puris]MBF6366417.1 transcriptional regulator [Nocardia puris]MBF6458244.1 transcriptional regulator [Nocardia puris]